MKKTRLRNFVSMLAALTMAFALVSCKNSDDDDSSGGSGGTSGSSSSYKTDSSLAAVADGYFRVNYLGSAYDLWVWEDIDETESAKCSNWNNTAITVTGKNGDFTYTDIKLAENPSTVKFIVRSAVGDNKLTGDCVFSFVKKYKEVFVKSGNDTVYVKSDLSTLPKGLNSAKITGEHTIELDVSYVEPSAENTVLKSGDKTLTITGISDNVVTVRESFKDYVTVKVSLTDDDGLTDTRTAVLASDLVNSWFSVSETTLAKLGYNDGVFMTWAPLASSAKVLLYADAASVTSKTVAETIDMTKNDDGTWSTENVSEKVASNKYYKYRFAQSDETYDVCDLWGKVASKNSEATQIVDINDTSLTSDWESSYVNPFGNSGADTKKYTEAVVYEMHIRDWSRAYVEDSKGTFEDITSALGENGAGDFAKHLADLGVTHVQILPMFEYATVGTADTSYNWGYNPYNWNTPESRYVKDMTDGGDAVLSMRKMIKAFHDAGIAVNMDVVYNHTNGTGAGSIYDMTIPQYFYRMNDDGTYSNGSGCGNETATNNSVVKYFVIDSLKHWMNDYHINGFRFDLMGLHETSLMSEIYGALYQIDKNVMVYGEPWTGGTSPVVNGTKKTNIDECVSTAHTDDNGVACFNDDFRNAIKGSEYPTFLPGHVSGTYADNIILSGLLGSTKTASSVYGFTDKVGRSINYVECHDNNTLFDKLAMIALGKTSFSGDLFAKLSNSQLSSVKKQNMFAAAYVFLAQGTPFINGGQEFLRTKRGNENSYSSSDTVNQITISMKETYSDVYNCYKGLIALRKSSAAFTSATKCGTETLSKGITKYTCSNGTDTFVIYFNATNSVLPQKAEVNAKYIDVSNGVVEDGNSVSKGGTINLLPVSFSILKVSE